MDNKVSIIIPVYNTKKYLKKCVESVLTQTYTNLQIILVDDGSFDGSSELCDQFMAKDSRVEVIHKKNEGLGLTRNAGLRIANGKYVTFLDSDDWFSSTHIENLVNEIEKNSVEFIIGSHTKCGYDEKEKEQLELPEYGEFRGEEKNKLMLLFIAADDESKRDLGIPMSVWSNLYLLDCLKEHEIYFGSEKEVASEDLFFNLSYLAAVNSVMLVREFGYFYRFNTNSISKGFDERQIERMVKLHQKLVETAHELRIKGNVDQRIKRCVLAKLRTLLFMIVRSNNRWTEKITKIRKLLKTSPFCECLDTYPINNYRLSLRLTTYLMKYRMVVLLYFVLWIKEQKVNR